MPQQRGVGTFAESNLYWTESVVRWVSYMGVAVLAWRGGMVWRGREADGRVRTWKRRWKDDDYRPANLPTESSVHIEVEGLSRSIPR